MAKKLSDAPEYLRAHADTLLAEIKHAGIQYTTLYRELTNKGIKFKLYGLNPKRSPNVDKWLEANGFVIARPKGALGYRGVTSATVYVNENYMIKKGAPLIPLDKKPSADEKHNPKRFCVFTVNKKQQKALIKFCNENDLYVYAY